MANEAENTNLKAQILQVAGRMFLEYGYSGTTFQKIADELNITKGSITYHFKNKFLIMEIFIDDFFNQLKAYIAVSYTHLPMATVSGSIRKPTASSTDDGFLYVKFFIYFPSFSFSA